MKLSPKFKIQRYLVMLSFVSGLVALGTTAASAAQTSPVLGMPGPIGMAGPIGDIIGDDIDIGERFPPSDEAYGRLVRRIDRLELEIITDGLPAGVYTVWWVIFNNPEACSDGLCNGGPDFFNPAVEASVFYATGAIVEDEGDGLGSARFVDVHHVGEYRGAKAVKDIIPIVDPGATIDTKKAEVHNIIKYHGPVSGDAYTLHDQATTLLGSCADGMANAVDTLGPFGIQCFDPQFVFFPSPGNK